MMHIRIFLKGYTNRVCVCVCVVFWFGQASFQTQSFKVRITSMGILNICNLWILLKTIVICLVGRKCHLHGLFRC